MHVDGGCHCGAIAFTAQLDPDKVVICHCRDCQIMSGGPYRSVAQVAEASFNLVRGTPATYIKTGDSGNKRALTFCRDCGSHLYAADATSGPDRVFGVRTGTLQQGAQLAPRLQVWCQSRMPWAQDLTALPQMDGQ